MANVRPFKIGTSASRAFTTLLLWFGGRKHLRGAGFEGDAKKRNAAVMAGWRVLHFTPRHIKSGVAVQMIEALIRKSVGMEIG